MAKKIIIVHTKEKNDLEVFNLVHGERHRPIEWSVNLGEWCSEYPYSEQKSLIKSRGKMNHPTIIITIKVLSSKKLTRAKNRHFFA